MKTVSSGASGLRSRFFSEECSRTGGSSYGSDNCGEITRPCGAFIVKIIKLYKIWKVGINKKKQSNSNINKNSIIVDSRRVCGSYQKITNFRKTDAEKERSASDECLAAFHKV